MAQRYGGAHSPKGNKPAGARPFEQEGAGVAGRVNLLFMAPFPLAIRAFWQEPTGLALFLGAFVILIFAAWMTREGVIAQAAYDARDVARRPAMPRKMFGSVFTGIGLAVATWATAGGFVGAIVIGVLGIAAHFMAFGADPMKDKGAGEIDLFQTDRVARAVTVGEEHLKAMSEAIARLKNRFLTYRMDQFQDTARQMFRTVENDPGDLTAARKYMGVYLQGARDATEKFVDLYLRKEDLEAKAEYETLLDDLEENFAKRTEMLLNDNKSDLDVEIKVLRERLERENTRH